MMVVYEGYGEVLICEKKDEKYLLKGWFAKETGRDKSFYDRSETEKGQIITIGHRFAVNLE